MWKKIGLLIFSLYIIKEIYAQSFRDVLSSAQITEQIKQADNECAARQVPGQSVLCVCNTTYCDDITRVSPEANQYVAYTTSAAGSRFLKSSGNIESQYTGDCATTLTLDPTTKYQSILGFGGAVTDAAAINWKNLTNNQLENYLIDSYYGQKGLEYNFIRTPIGGCDFSTHAYAYNELPVNDFQLTNFSLTVEDYDYKIPMIKAINKAAGDREVYILSTAWSPPTWMKTTEGYSGFSRLKPDCYQSYALYYLKYIQAYEKEGIKIWGISTTNEPLNGVVPLLQFNSLGWTPSTLGKWLANNLGPTIKNEFPTVQILGADDQRYTIPFWFNSLIKLNPEALKYMDGVGVHFYADKLVPPSILQLITNTHPEKFILSTEACEGSFPWQKEKVLLGSWDRAVSYITDILENLNYNVVGWIDWNLCLNIIGGPNWANNFVDSPIIVFPENQEFVKQPKFYAVGHFSKFIPRGSTRIKVTETKPAAASSLQNVAVVTPYNTLVTVIHNSGDAQNVCVNVDDKTVPLTLEAKSVLTLEMNL